MRLTLTHLTFLGAKRQPATVAFGPAMTVIRGPSDTGKSFIGNAIDYMLGAKQLKEIPEREGYSRVLLGLTLPDGTPVTLSRSTEGGNFSLYREDIRSWPLPPTSETLSRQHSANSERSLSSFLLKEVGLDRRLIRKNVRNATDSLSFRNIAHLCIVDETEMQSEVPPAFTGSYVTRTKEISVLKLLLQDEDDSGLLEVQDQHDRRKLSNAKIDVVDRLIGNLETQLTDAPQPDELRTQLAKLTSSIDNLSESISDLVDERGRVAQEIQKEQTAANSARSEQGDLRALRSRFNLLQSQYESDLARLSMVREAGTLLNYFRRGTCPFCGAEPEHQHQTTQCEGDTTEFGAAIDSQFRRTEGLFQDLAGTVEEVTQQSNLLDERIHATLSRIDDQRRRVSELEAALEHRNHNLQELVQTRSSIERSLGLYDQIATLDKMKLVVADEAVSETAAVVAGITLRAQREFSAALMERLESWNFPDPTTVRYDASEQDITAGDQFRAAHGKGVRSILHAAFTIALGQYCFDRDLPHPGFMILDSPLITYRPPDEYGAAREAEIPDLADGLTSDIVSAFFTDVQHHVTGQVIIFENTNPPDDVDPQTVDVSFTKNVQAGRYGFFPYRDPAIQER